MTPVQGAANVFWVGTYRTAAGTPHLIVNGTQSGLAASATHPVPTSVDRPLNLPPSK